MLYLRVENESGDIAFAPVANDIFYIHCKKCNEMEQLVDLLDFVAELGDADFESKGFDICSECLEEQCRIEDENLKANK